MAFEYNEHTKLVCVTYADEYSAGKQAINDLHISFHSNVFAAGSSALRCFDVGDYTLICANENKTRKAFVGKITERIHTPLTHWHDQGGKIWPYNFIIEPVTGITDITPGTEKRIAMETLLDRCGLKKTTLFNSRFCSKKLISGLACLIEKGLFERLP